MRQDEVHALYDCILNCKRAYNMVPLQLLKGCTCIALNSTEIDKRFIALLAKVFIALQTLLKFTYFQEIVIGKRVYSSTNPFAVQLHISRYYLAINPFAVSPISSIVWV